MSLFASKGIKQQGTRLENVNLGEPNLALCHGPITEQT